MLPENTSSWTKLAVSRGAAADGMTVRRTDGTEVPEGFMPHCSLGWIRGWSSFLYQVVMAASEMRNGICVGDKWFYFNILI